MAKNNKKCVYITDENIEYIKQKIERLFKKCGEARTFSHEVNKAIDVLRTKKLFKKKISSNNKYEYAIFHLKPELIDMLDYVAKKYDSDAVVQLVNWQLLKFFQKQIKEKDEAFPNRSYVGDNYIEKLATACKKVFDVVRVRGNTWHEEV